MPSWEIFAAEDEAYRESVLPVAIRKRVSVEAGSSFGWHRWIADGTIISIDRFGVSAPGEEVLKNFGFTPEKIVQETLAILGK